ncbi:MAG: hypothetical protein ACERKO_05405 [Acetanaerobacterium sp.]
MSLETMYPAITNSPATVTTGALNTNGTEVGVGDSAVFGLTYPQLATLGDSSNAETVLITGVVGNILTITRAVEGTAKAWATGTIMARNFCAIDHNTLIANVVEINNGVDNLSGNVEYLSNSFTSHFSDTTIHTTADEKAKIAGLDITGDGDCFLADDGTYKAVVTDIPIATTTTAGKVKASDTVAVAADGTMSVDTTSSAIASIPLPTASWTENTENGWWTQLISDSAIVDGVKVDISFTAEQVKQLVDDGASIMVVNDNGIATAYAFNAMPTMDLTAQIEIRQVTA